MARRPSDPFWWLLFGAGGTAAAFLAPVLILLTGIALPAGWVDGAAAYDRLRALALYPLTRVLLFGLIALFFFHWAHRFRSTLEEGLGLERASAAIAAACYGAAVLGTVLTAVVLARV